MSDVTLFHSPQTRSTGAVMLLEELGAPFHLHVVDMRAGENRQPAYLAVNPMGKVPAVKDGEALVTEQAAVFLHLADRFPDKGLAPAIGDPLRGPYLRWMVFYGSSFEPALVDRAMKRDPGDLALSPYGTYEAVIETLTDQLKAGPYLLGERFSAADILWGVALDWTTAFGLVERSPEIAAYVESVTSRPAYIKVMTSDTERAKAQDAQRPADA